MSRLLATAAYYVFIIVPFTISSATNNATDNATCVYTSSYCISSYDELLQSMNSGSNSSNMLAILNAYYPPNRDESVIVDVKYCIVCNDTDQECVEQYNFQWLDEHFLVPIDYDLLQALTFGAADLNRQQLRIFLHPFCNTIDVIEQLTRLTSLVSMQLVILTTEDDRTFYGDIIIMQ